MHESGRRAEPGRGRWHHEGMQPTRVFHPFRPAPDSAAGLAIRRGKSPWIEGIHLLWSMWLFVTPMFSSHGYDSTWVWLTVCSFPLFVLLYVFAIVSPRRHSWIYSVGMVALSAALLRWYPSGFSYFVFGCVLLRSHEDTPLWKHLLGLQLLNAGFVAFALWIGYPWQSIAWMPVMTTVIAVIVHVQRRSHCRDAQLALSQAEVRRLAATAERERIGRDLHDLLGHTLSLITLKLELSRKLFDRDPETARAELEEAEKVARHALAEVRSAVTGIRAADIAAELAAARLMLESSDVALEYDEPPSGLSNELERGLSLVLREAATNVARHARAHRASIRFRQDSSGIVLTIEDDGCGGIHGEGNGLRGMRERVAALGGTLSVESPRGRGTRLIVRLGLEPAKPDFLDDQEAAQAGISAPELRYGPA